MIDNQTPLAEQAERLGDHGITVVYATGNHDPGASDIGPRRIIACVIGFLGTLLVIRPSFAAIGLAACLPLATAFLFAIYMVLTRRMAQRMHPLALQGYTALAAASLALPLLGVLAFLGPETPFAPVWPDAFGWGTLLGVGVAATLTHLVLSFALRLAPAATIAPLHYVEIAAATAFGFVIFGEFPGPIALLGIAIIVGAGLFVILREHQTSASPKPVPPPVP